MDGEQERVQRYRHTDACSCWSCTRNAAYKKRLAANREAASSAVWNANKDAEGVSSQPEGA